MDDVYRAPHPRLRERSLPVPRGMIAIGSVSVAGNLAAATTLWISVNSHEQVPSPPHTKTRAFGTLTTRVSTS